MAHDPLEAEKGESLLEHNPGPTLTLKSPRQNVDPLPHPVGIRFKQHSQSPFFLLAWKGDILSWFGSLAFFIAIFGILIYVDGKLQSDLQDLHITPNALIGLLATFAQSLLLKPVGSAIGQVKWLRSLQKRPIDDFRVIDGASRGAWGGVQLLAARKGGWVASSGAAVAIVALAMHTFFQEALHFDAAYPYTREATMPIARYANGTGPLPLGKKGYTATGFDSELLSAPYIALYSPAHTNFTATAYCSTGNCTWEPYYESLGICNTCQDITDKLKFTEVDGRTEYYLPNGFGLQSPDLNNNDLFFLNVTTSLAYNGKGAWGSVAFNKKGSKLLSVLAVGAANGTIPIQLGVNDNADDKISLPAAPPVALECLLQYCIRTMRGRSVNGFLQETVISNWTDQTHFPDGFDGSSNLSLRSPTTGDEFVAQSQAVSGTQDLLRELLVGEVYSYYHEDALTPLYSTSILEPIYGAMNTSSTGFQDLMDNLANSLSLNLRTIKYQPPPVKGKAFTSDSQATVEWKWLILPIFELIATLLLLVAVIIETKRKDMVPWGNSTLAYVFHGLNKLPEGGSYRETQEDMENSARELLVEFQPYDNGGHLVVAGYLGEESYR